jgi:hypothetical protein
MLGASVLEGQGFGGAKFCLTGARGCAPNSCVPTEWDKYVPSVQAYMGNLPQVGVLGFPHSCPQTLGIPEKFLAYEFKGQACLDDRDS